MTSNVTEVTTVTGSNSKPQVAALLVQRLRHLSGVGNSALVAVLQVSQDRLASDVSLDRRVSDVSLDRLESDQRFDGPLAFRRDVQQCLSVTRPRAHVCTAGRIMRRRIAQIQRNSNVVQQRLLPPPCPS